MQFDNDAIKRVIEKQLPAIYYLNDEEDEKYLIFEKAAKKM